jgi:hypothetical protein
MAFGAVETNQAVEDNAQVPIFKKAVGFSVETRRLGTRRKVDSAQIGTDADRSMIHVSKSILDSPELKKIEQLDSVVRRCLSDFCLPSNFKSGIYLLPINSVEEVDARFIELQSQREGLVDDFVASYTNRRDEAQSRLGSLFDTTDYPPEETVRMSFSLTGQYVTFDTPSSLKNIKAEIFKREREKADVMWKDALEECRMLLRATMRELVAHIGERLTPKEDGKAKSFHGSMLTKLDSFMTSFADRNIADDEELASLVKEARAVMHGVDVKELRKEDVVREALRGQMDELKGKLDLMVIDKPSRAFASETEE